MTRRVNSRRPSPIHLPPPCDDRTSSNRWEHEDLQRRLRRLAPKPATAHAASRGPAGDPPLPATRHEQPECVAAPLPIAGLPDAVAESLPIAASAAPLPLLAPPPLDPELPAPTDPSTPPEPPELLAPPELDPVGPVVASTSPASAMPPGPVVGADSA